MQLPQRLFDRVAYRVLTPRLCLRGYEPKDAAAVQAAVIANLEHLAPWMKWAQVPPTLEEQLGRVLQGRASFDLGVEFVYGLFDREHGQYLGSAGLHPRCGPGGLELGYWIDRNHEGRGLVTEAAGALTRVALEIMGASFIEVRHEPANVRSGAIPERLGFRREAVLRGRCAFPDGERRDATIWSMFAEDLAETPAAKAELEAFDSIGRPLL